MAADGLPLLRELDELAVNAVSPDRSLRVSLTARSGLRIEVDPRREPPSSEAELARQVSVTVGGVLRGFREAADSIVGRGVEPRPDEGPAEALTARRRKQAEELAAVEVTAVSGLGLVSVVLRGRGDVELRLRPRCVDTKGTDVVLDDIRDGLETAMDRLDRRLADIQGL